MTMTNTYSRAKDGNKLLSPHFAVREFHSKDGVDTILINMELINKLESLFTALKASKCIIISGYRTPTYSVSVGGYATDPHTKGIAADVRFFDSKGNIISGKTVCCKAQDLGFSGIGYISETSTHLDVSETRKWRGDEKTGKSGLDFYSYFGIAKPQSKIIPKPTLKEGSHGESVKQLQVLLRVSADGIFGPKTKIALKNWQTSHNLKPDGIYGAKSEAMMKK